MEEELLSTDEVARFLGVGQVTVWRWCREGNLPCVKIGRYWRVRRQALEEFVRRSERSETLVGRLSSFLEVPDNVFAIVEDRELMLRMDTAFFRVAESRNGVMVKYHRAGRNDPVEEIRSGLRDRGIEVSRLEDEGRLYFIAEEGEPENRIKALKRLVAEQNDEGWVVWVNFNWEERIEVETALRQQQEITQLIEDSNLVIKTTVLEAELDRWSGALQRRAQTFHSGMIWLSRTGLALSRVTPPPAL